MIPKVTLKELYNDVFRRSTLISIPMLDELFEVPGSEFTKKEIFYTIVKDAVLRFYQYYPLVLVQKLFISVDTSTRKGTIKPNFEAYLKGIVDENSVCIAPAIVNGLAYNGYVGSSYPLRNFRFENGEFWDFWYTTGVYYGNCICIYPMFEEYVESSKEFTDRCAVYYMDKNSTNWAVFRDEVYSQTCRYIFTTKQNMQLTNMPIELFQGLENDYNNINNRLEQKYSNALPASAWLM